MLSFPKKEKYKEDQNPTTNNDKQTNKLDNMGSTPDLGETPEFKKENKMYGGRKKNKKRGGQPAPPATTPLNDILIRSAISDYIHNRDVCINLYGEIENWNTTAVTNMEWLFIHVNLFNEDISGWDTSNVTTMRGMFNGQPAFNQPIGTWDTHNVTNMGWMFEGARSFNQPIGGWDTQNVIDMGGMFYDAMDFNQPIGTWNTQNVINMHAMLSRARSFNQLIDAWNTHNVTNMQDMFNLATSFNQPIGGWDTQNVIDMQGMFNHATSFNQPIGGWNTIKVTNMQGMFNHATSFNRPIGGWDTQNVTNMKGMFEGARSFDGPIGTWNTKKVTDMSAMFYGARSFNQPIGGWDTQNVIDMQGMFMNATSFNRPIGTWDTRNVTDMMHMFYGASSFNQDLRKWKINDLNPIGNPLVMMPSQLNTAMFVGATNMEDINLPKLGQTVRNQIGRQKRENFDLAHSISRDQVAADDDSGFIPNYQESVACAGCLPSWLSFPAANPREPGNPPQGSVAHNKMITAVKNRENQLKALDIMNTIMKAEDHTNPDAGPYKLLGGKGRRSNTKKKRSSYKKRKTQKNVVLLPKLRKIDDSKKKYKYKLSNPSILRKKAINEGIHSEVKKTNKTKKQAAAAKKGRFNILRIYRRNKNKNQCKIITRDMRYIDKKYGLNKTNSICGGKRNKTKKIYN